MPLFLNAWHALVKCALSHDLEHIYFLNFISSGYIFIRLTFFFFFTRTISPQFLSKLQLSPKKKEKRKKKTLTLTNLSHKALTSNRRLYFAVANRNRVYLEEIFFFFFFFKFFYFLSQ